MVLIDSVKYACATCIKGHRSSTCNHDSRPLIEIKKKGRPVTQCVHCRELRKTKQVHVKCLCEGRPELSAAPRTVLPAAVLVGASATKTAANNTRSNSTLTNSSGKPSCDCKSTAGSCDCCTPKHLPRQSAATAALDVHGGGKPQGLARSNTYHAASPNPLSMNHEASLSNHQVNKGGSSLQRSTSLHGAAAGGHPHSNASVSHHPLPQHHHARHFAPYHIAHHNHHYHARFDVPEEEKDPASSKTTASAGANRRHRSSSVSHSDVSRPFPPPTSVYVNGSGAVSMPDVLAWSSGDVSPISPYNQQPTADPLLADPARSSTFLPQSGSEYDALAPAATDELIRQLGNGNRAFDEPVTPEGYPAHFTSAADYTASDPTAGDLLQYSGIPEFQFASSADVGLEQRDQSPIFPDSGVYGAEYDMTNFLSLPQQMSASALSGSGAGSSPPPSSTTGSGSLTSRSSSRASGAAFDFYDMTPADAGDRGRIPRQYGAQVAFPVADPFESESTTAIPPFEAFDRPLRGRPTSLDIDKSQSPISPDVRDDGNGTQFPAWPHRGQQKQLSSSPISSTNLSSAGMGSFEGDGYEFANPSATATTTLAYGGHRGPSLEFDDNAWTIHA